MDAPAVIHCPHCEKPLPEHVLRAAASVLGKRRTISRAGGRPKSTAERCPCGLRTLATAQKRKFDCCRKAGVVQPEA